MTSPFDDVSSAYHTLISINRESKQKMMKIKSFFYAGFLASVCIQVDSTSTQTKLPQVTSCGEVDPMKNAILSIQSGVVGDEVVYTCIDSLLQIGVGNGRRMCNASGAWQRVANVSDPVCEVSPFSQPPVIANAKSTVFRISADLLGASYACRTRFVLADGGQGNRSCNGNMSSNETTNVTWELTAGDVDPLCMKPGSNCDEPPPVANAHRTLTDNEVTYTCYAGYNVTSGHVHRVCMMNGSFNGSSPVCTFHCGEPQDLVDHDINITSSRGGSVPTVTCKSAAVANISSNITCNVTSGSWDKSGIECTEILIVVHVMDERGMAQVCAEKMFVASSDVDLSKTNISEISTVGVECTQPRLGSSVNVKFSGTSPPEGRLHEIRVFGRKCATDISLSDAGNFCRNPNRSRSSVWCYVDIVDMEWDYCPTIVCDEHCMFDFDGRHYYGQESVTASGHQCLPWDAEGLPFSRDLDFPYGKGPSCRNPSASQTVPWCYTCVEPQTYEHCRIPNCPNVLNVTEDKPSVWVTVLLCVSHEGESLNRSASILYREELCGLSDAGPLTSLFCRLDQHFVLIILNCSETAVAPTPQDTTSSGATTTHDTVSTTPPALQAHNLCACACNRQWPRLTLADPTAISREVQAIKGVLKVEKMALSANIRKKTSVGDERVSVAATGLLFLAALLSLFIFFLASDVVSVVTFLLHFLARKQAPAVV